MKNTTAMYTLIERAPSPEEFVELRETVGWGIHPLDTTAIAMKNSLYAVCALSDETIIGMARVVGDSSICFYVQDVIVKPQFQGLGVGKALMQKVMAYITQTAAPGAIVGLMSVKGKENFYEKFGFWKRPNEIFGHGMMQFWQQEMR